MPSENCQGCHEWSRPAFPQGDCEHQQENGCSVNLKNIELGKHGRKQKQGCRGRCGCRFRGSVTAERSVGGGKTGPRKQAGNDAHMSVKGTNGKGSNAKQEKEQGIARSMDDLEPAARNCELGPVNGIE